MPTTSSKNVLEIHSLENLTTRFPLFKDQSSNNYEMIAYNENQISFTAPFKPGTIGLLIQMNAIIYVAGVPHEFIASGKITNVENFSFQCIYTIELARYDHKLWRKFQEAVQSTQDRTDLLFRSMRDLD